MEKLNEIGLKVDFNQGLDARLIDEEKASILADLKIPIVRMAYDTPKEEVPVERAIQLLEEHGVRKRNILLYTLFNFYTSENSYKDTPEFFFERIKHIAEIGCVSYPMRYEPLNSLKKNQFISPYWTPEQLEAIADARRVIGFGGAFPPYKGLVEKFIEARDFNEAFELRPINTNKNEIIGNVHPISEPLIDTCSQV